MCLLECRLLSCICLFPAFSYLLFFASKELALKLSSFFTKVLLLFSDFIIVLLTHFQPPLLISRDDHVHHNLIGTILLFTLAISDI